MIFMRGEDIINSFICSTFITDDNYCWLQQVDNDVHEKLNNISRESVN
jgi:hypothetical protein